MQLCSVFQFSPYRLCLFCKKKNVQMLLFIMINAHLRDRSFFMREGGLVGFGKHHLKIAWPPSAYQFFHVAPPYSGHFLGWPPNKQYLDFNFFNISLLSPCFTFCAHREDNIYNPYTTESCCLKNKSKEREVNFGSPSYGSPWACGIWPLIGISLIWIDECPQF